MALADSVNQLAAEVGGLSGRVVELNREVQHIATTFIPRDEVEERLLLEETAMKQRRVTVYATCLLGLIILGTFGWFQHQATVRQEGINKAGGQVILCLYGEMAAHRHFDREYSLVAAKSHSPEFYEAVKKLSDEVPQTAFDVSALKAACQPIADAINSGKYNYGLSNKEGK